MCYSLRCSGPTTEGLERLRRRQHVLLHLPYFQFRRHEQKMLTTKTSKKRDQQNNSFAKQRNA